MGNRCRTGCGKWASEDGLCRSCKREGKTPSPIKKVFDTPLSTPRMANREPAHLYVAARKGDTKAVQELLEHPFFDAETETGVNKPFSDVNERVCKPQHEQDGSTALVAAAEVGHSAVVELLLRQPDVEVNACRTDGATALFIASVLGNTSCVTALLAASGVDVNQAAETGATAVLIAAVNGHTACLAALLAHPDVDVNRADEEGYTPLFLAATYGQAESVRMLLEHPKIETNRKIGDSTALMSAVVNDVPDAVASLAAHPSVDVNASSAKLGASALFLACLLGRERCLPPLLARQDVDVNATGGPAGEAAIHAAVRMGHASCARLLLEHQGVDVNLTRIDGATPLFLAAVKGHAACAKLLLESASIEVNRQNDLGATATFLAVVHGHADCLEALLAHPDVDAHTPDRDGTTPLEAAEHADTAGSQACAALLRAHAGGALGGAAHAEPEETRSPTGASPPAVAVA